MTVSEKEKEALKQTSLKLGFLFVVIGAALFASANLPLGEITLTLFIGGVGIIGFGLVFIVKGAEFGEDFLVKQRLKQEQLTDEQYHANFKADESGIIWVWIVALVTWAIMAMAYFALSMVLYMVLDSVEAFAPWEGHAWESQYMGVIELTRNVCAWFLIIMTVGIIGWALINSARREEPTYPAW